MMISILQKYLKKNEINGFMTINEIYNKVKLQIKFKPFVYFILPFGINKNKTPIIAIHNNIKVCQNLDNLDMLSLNDGIYFSDTIFLFFSFVDEISIGKNRIS